MKSSINDIKELLSSKEIEEVRLKHFLYTAFLLWSFIIFISLSLNLFQDNRQIKTIAENIARANFQANQTIVAWAGSHGGIYVPVDKRTPPNPHLTHIPYRDITKPDGTKLTLMNSAYMLRQMSDEHTGLYGTKTKITSLKYLYEGNKPDEWETKALKSFANGEHEAYEYTLIKDEPYLRLMRPMYINKSCLKCHGFQGYKIGDVRGAISISLPLKNLYALSNRNIAIFFSLHFLIWLLGVLGIGIFARREYKHLQNNKKAKEELETSEARFRILYNKSPDMYVSTSPKDASILFCNDTLLKKTGYSREEIIGSQIFMMYHEECMPEVHKTFEEFVEKGVIKDRELILKAKDGTKIDVNLNVNMVEDENGNPLYSMSSWRDITEHKKMENEIEVAHKYLQGIFDVTPNIMIATDGFDIKNGNTAMLKFTGFNSIKDFKKAYHCICDLFVGGDEYIHAKMGGLNWLEYILAHPNKIHKVCMLKDDKLHKFMVLTESLTNVDADNYTLVVFNDITELENAMLELKEKDEIMMTQSRHAAMGEMISMIAHQWRQPISAIAMDANNILADIGLEMVDNETLATTSQDIIRQTQELSKTIDDFKNFFRPGKTAEEVLVEDIFNEAFSVIGKSLQNNNVEVKKDFKGSDKITTYSRELMQVFINIMKNSKEALVENNIQNREIDISVEESSKTVSITICDNGGGIDESIIDKIFDPYFSTKDEKQGTGIGLYMSKTIVEKHLKGTIAVNNIDGGVCFKITLPKTL